MLGRELTAPPSTERATTHLDNLSYQDYLKATLPRGWTADAPHIRLIAKHLDAVERGEIDRLAIHMPPRSAKTESVTVRYAPYCMERDPTQNVLVTGYNERFARRLSRKARIIAQERPPGRIAIAPDKMASDEWATVQGGVLMARGVGSPPTGTGFTRIIIDDPVRRREDADSEVYREKVWDWYTDDLYTRLEPGGAIIMVCTLWHHDDIAARAVASEPGRWTVLKLPALAMENDPLGRAPGAALWPERFDVAALQRIHDVMRQNEGERGWESLYQQNPSPRGGTFFKTAWFAIVPLSPNGVQRVRYWDMAGAESGKGDYTVGVLMAKTADNYFYVEDVVRGQWAATERNAMILQTAQLDKQWHKNVKTVIEQAPGLAKESTDAVIRLMAGYNVYADRVVKDKVSRAEPLAAMAGAKNVKLIGGAWNRDFLNELATFPLGKHDDQVDAASGAFNQLSPLGSGTVSKEAAHALAGIDE